jgi:hypothetical protein
MTSILQPTFMKDFMILSISQFNGILNANILDVLIYLLEVMCLDV